jgi:hypothetical protein
MHVVQWKQEPADSTLALLGVPGTTAAMLLVARPIANAAPSVRLLGEEMEVAVQGRMVRVWVRRVLHRRGTERGLSY